jgi:molecular chaperone GrpE
MVDGENQKEGIQESMPDTSHDIENESTPNGDEAIRVGLNDSVESAEEAFNSEHDIDVQDTSDVLDILDADSDLEEPEGGIDYRSAVHELTREIASLKSQVEERTTQYMRIVADFDNFRKRTQKEKEDLEQKVKCDTVVELLPIVDNFERARSQIKPQTDSEMTIHKSYQGVYKDLVDRMKRIGVSPMRAEGKEFDPNLHEAVMRESTNEHAEGTVIEELVRGYVLGDRVLRHAMVKVAAASDNSAEAFEDNRQSE